MRSSLLLLPATTLVLAVIASPAVQGQDDALVGQPLSEHAQVGAAPEQVAAALSGIARGDWEPEVNDERPRGAALAVYPKVAPSVAIVRSLGGHGTGFVIDEEGWIITNHHVVDEAGIDPESGGRLVAVHLGALQDGWMTLSDTALPAVVYKASAERDLALLKLLKQPAAPVKLIPLPLAKKVPPPGSDCVAIGHPAAGALWTVRSGEIAGLAIYPREKIDLVMERLGMAAADRTKLALQLAQIPQRKVLLSSIGLNPGDSGGPLVNSEGELIAVSYAIPKGSKDSGISLDKFSYHLHLEELQEFLKNRPTKPELYIPKPLPPALIAELQDGDGDGKPETLACGINRKTAPTGFLVDLDQDSDAAAAQKSLDGNQMPKWDFELAQKRIPEAATFYDTDNDGSLDLVLIDIDHDNKPDSQLQVVGGKWTQTKPTVAFMLVPELFEDEVLVKRLKKILAPRKPAPTQAAPK